MAGHFSVEIPGQFSVEINSLWLILAICALMVIALGWAWIGQLDIVAVAAGKIEPSGKVKTVESMLTGRISDILVHDGDKVVAGQIVIQLDGTEFASELDRLNNQQSSLGADVLRIKSVLSALEERPEWRSDFTVAEPDWGGLPSDVKSAEEGVMRRDLADLRAKLGSIESQITERNADIGAMDDTIEAQRQLVSTLTTMASMRSELVDKEAGTKANWLDALQALQTQQVTLATHEAQRVDDAAAVNVLSKEGEKTWTEFLAGYARTLNTTQVQLDDTAHKVAQARAEVELMSLRSPVDGVVEASTVTSIGQVVSIGQEVLRVVPSDSKVVIRAYLPNEDIGFVTPGQKATVKVAAYPFTQYGTLAGTVSSVGKDALGGEGAGGGKAADQASPVDATGILVFPVTIELPPGRPSLNGVDATLSAGMQVTAEINTGRRRILDYLFAPVIEVGSSALHER